mmetsp:Transcript_4488/g.16958  ORF Transcript_4488/g.16958 Transcript_4488/m.16958 type:complete len:210 (+) Transcript_4488:3547-4176(+)
MYFDDWRWVIVRDTPVPDFLSEIPPRIHRSGRAARFLTENLCSLSQVESLFVQNCHYFCQQPHSHPQQVVEIEKQCEVAVTLTQVHRRRFFFPAESPAANGPNSGLLKTHSLCSTVSEVMREYSHDDTIPPCPLLAQVMAHQRHLKGFCAMIPLVVGVHGNSFVLLALCFASFSHQLLLVEPLARETATCKVTEKHRLSFSWSFEEHFV